MKASNIAESIETLTEVPAWYRQRKKNRKLNLVSSKRARTHKHLPRHCVGTAKALAKHYWNKEV